MHRASLHLCVGHACPIRAEGGSHLCLLTARPSLLTGRALAVACLVAGSFAARAGAAPADVLRSALRGPTRPYEGIQRTVVYGDTATTESRVRVRSDGRGGIRREFQTGPAAGAVVIQRGADSWQKPPGGAFERMPSASGPDPRAVAATMATNYAISVAEGRPILGRKVKRVAVKARRTFNPSRALHVDAVGLVVRDELFAPDGRRRSVTEFVSVTFGPQTPASFAVPAAARAGAAGYGPGSFSVRSSASAVRTETGRPVPAPAHVPEGYSVSTYGIMTTGSGLKTPAARYSDGLASFTIFVRGARPGPPEGRGRGRGGGPRRLGRGPHGFMGSDGSETVESDRQRVIVTFSSRQAAYILIGDLASDELVRVARSLP